jgi:protein-tyrosine phosphatase
LNETDVIALQQLGLKLICDLRLEVERSVRPNPHIAGVEAIRVDVAAGSRYSASALHELAKDGNPSAVLNFIKGVYRDFVDLRSARQAYRELVERMADPGSLPMLFHCTGGKDRTGWGQAILLSILDVPRETITADYALTDHFLSPAALDHVRESMPGLDEHTFNTLVRADPVYLATAFDAVHERYGSFANYLQRGLQLDERIIGQIRANFLQ